MSGIKATETPVGRMSETARLSARDGVRSARTPPAEPETLAQHLNDCHECRFEGYHVCPTFKAEWLEQPPAAAMCGECEHPRDWHWPDTFNRACSAPECACSQHWTADEHAAAKAPLA